MSPQHRVLVVGVGSIGERHVRCFAATGRASLMICEANAELRRSISDRHSVSQAFETYSAALAAQPGIVVIATPAHLHVPMAMAAVRQGISALIEKPLSTRLDGVDELIGLIDERQVTAAVAYVYRCHPSLTAMREAVRSVRFGEPVQIVATCGQHFPTYRPAYREIYYTDRATGGGAVQDALTHIVNAGEWLVGPIDKVVADVDHQVLEGVTVEDTVHVLARHGGVMGCYSLNQHQAPNEVTITVVCTRGTARFENHANRWRWMTEPGETWHDEAGLPQERDALFVRQAHAFLDAADGIAAPLCSVSEGRKTLQANLAILASAERGSWQTISK